MEGNNKQPGIVKLSIQSIFDQLENKKFEIKNSEEGDMNFKYTVRVRYIEVLKESIIDLFAPQDDKEKGMKKAPEYKLDEWEGPTIKNADWITIGNHQQFNQIFLSAERNKTTGQDEQGTYQEIATYILTVELIQNTYYVDK